MNNTAMDFDKVFIRQSDFSEPLVVFPLVWMVLGCAINFTVVLYVSKGWLINPKLTKQVIVACSVAFCWLIVYIIQSFFIMHRSVMVLAVWMGQLLTLMVSLQHVELLKLFVCLSEYWTLDKCTNYQRALCVGHFVILFGGYIWPLGLETNKTATMVKEINKVNDYGNIAWGTIVVVSNHFCAILSIHLMWSHIKEPKKRQVGQQQLPMKRYTNAMILIICHAFFDILALITFAISKTVPFNTPRDAQLNFMYSRVSLSIIAFHVAMFPIVFIQVRDLKFHERLKSKSNGPNTEKGDRNRAIEEKFVFSREAGATTEQEMDIVKESENGMI